MSKTLGTILTIGAAIAVNAIPGIGQALSVAIGSTLASAVAGAVTLAGVTAALSSAASLLGLGPKTPKPEQTQTSIKSPIPARIIANGPRRLWGASLLYMTSANGRTVDVWAYSDSRLNSVLQIYLNDDKVSIVSEHIVSSAPDGRYGSSILAGYNTGLPTETAFASVIAELPGIWTSTHRGDGIVTGYMIKYQAAQKNYLTIYPQGDNVTMSIAGEWGLHFDPRDAGQDPYDPETWEYSENAAVQFLTYLIKFRALDWDTQGEPTRDIVEAAMDDCDVSQPLSAGGSEPRYRSAVVHKSTDEPASIISEYLSCFDGWFCFNEENHLILYSGRYYEPTVILGSDKIVAYRDSGGTPVEDQINEIKITYISAEHDYADVECQPWRDEDAITASGREPNSTSLSVQSPSYTQNRRLAKRMMARINAEDKFTISTTYSGQEILGQRYINITIQEGAYTGYSGPVEILTSPEIDMMTGGVSFECCTVDPNIDDWNPETEDGYGAPLGDYVMREPVATPTINSYSVIFSEDGLSAQINIEPDDPGMEDITWYGRWRVDGDSSWNEQEYSDTDAGPIISLVTGLVPINSMIEIAVSYRTADGRYSDWSSTSTVDTTSEGEIEFDGGDSTTEA